MLTVAISGLPNRILRFTVRHGCEPCRTVEGRKCNKNGRRHTADYRYGTVRSPKLLWWQKSRDSQHFVKKGFEIRLCAQLKRALWEMLQRLAKNTSNTTVRCINMFRWRFRKILFASDCLWLKRDSRDDFEWHPLQNYSLWARKNMDK